MSTASAPARRGGTTAAGTRPTRRVLLAVVVVAVAVGAFFSTKVVPNDSQALAGTAAFDPASYGRTQFPKVQAYVTKNAVQATALATALQADPNALSKYGHANSSGVGQVVPVAFTGTVGPADKTGLPVVTIPGMPSGYLVHVQLGPAINGTELRDATGDVQLGSFENQIQYQDAGAAINDQVKALITSKGGADALQGKTVQVGGVTTIINPQSWNVTPATLQVQQ